MLILKIAVWLLASVISAILYRAGGQSQDPTSSPTWMPMWLRHSWCRDWLVPACSLTCLLLFWHNAEWYKLLLAFIVSYGLMGGALSTYWDFLFGFDNYYAHGFMVGLSVFPFAIIGMSWWLLAAQTIIISVGMGLWSNLIDKDSDEEFGRGFIATIFRII
jgi:hypothetical protein